MSFYFHIIGPRACGKSTLADELQKRGVVLGELRSSYDHDDRHTFRCTSDRKALLDELQRLGHTDIRKGVNYVHVTLPAKEAPALPNRSIYWAQPKPQSWLIEHAPWRLEVIRLHDRNWRAHVLRDGLSVATNCFNTRREAARWAIEQVGGALEKNAPCVFGQLRSATP